MNTELISKNLALEAIESIRGCIWDVDIPSPTVPEYVEHHEQIQELMQRTNEWIEKIQKLEEDDDLISRKAAVAVIRDKKVPVNIVSAISYNMGVDDCATTLEYMPGV